MCYPRDQSVPRAAGGEGRGTNARFGELRKKRLRCSEKKPMCYSGIHRAERNPRHLKDGISESSGPRPPYFRWRMVGTFENPCPLAHSVARSPATGIGNIDIKEEGFDWMSGKGGEEGRGEEEDIPGLSRCSFIPSIPHGERQVNP